MHPCHLGVGRLLDDACTASKRLAHLEALAPSSALEAARAAVVRNIWVVCCCTGGGLTFLGVPYPTNAVMPHLSDPMLRMALPNVTHRMACKAGVEISLRVLAAAASPVCIGVCSASCCLLWWPGG